MFGLGPRELIVLVVILLLLFGSKKIPELARDIGEAVREIRGAFAGKTPDNKTDKTDSL